MPQIDTRLIQTAVMGGKHGDRPVILPEEAHNLDEFRRQYGQDEFWCGTLLGGCGEKLMTKRYETKVCHFAHHPDRYGTNAPCHRPSEGVDSADHLFIKQHVKEWLTRQGHAAEASLRSLGTGPGDAVDFWLRATEQHLRFELRPEDYRRWRKAAESLGAREGHVEWVFRPENAITRDMVARQGYALRVNCETAGTDRRVLIGTATADRPIAWDPLNACRMTRDGLVTPALEELRAAGKIRIGGMRNTPLPTSLPIAGAQLVFAIDSGAAAPTDSPFQESGRHLYVGYLKPTANRIIRTVVSLPADIPPPADDYVYQLSGAVRILITDPVGTTQAYWAVRADAVKRLNGIAAERTGLWRPSVALDIPVGPPAPQDTPTRGERKWSAKAPATAVEPPSQAVHVPQAKALREELLRIARRRGTTTWKQLSREFDTRLRQLSESTLRDLLVEVDQPVRDGALPLSVLVLASGQRHLHYLSAILRSLGVDAPDSGAALQQWSTETIRQIHDTYSPSESLVPSAAPRRTSSAPQNQPKAASLDVSDRQLGLLREKTEEASRIAARAAGRRAERLAAVIAETEAHVRQYAAVREDDRALRRWNKTGERLQERLDDLIGRIPMSSQAVTPRPAVPAPLPAVTTAKEIFSHAEPPKRSPAIPAVAVSHAELAQQTFTHLFKSFAEGKASGNLPAVRRIGNEADAVSEVGLSAQEKLRLRALKDEMRTWIKEKEFERAHSSLQTVLETLPLPGDPQEAAKLRRALDHAKALRWMAPGELPQHLSDGFSDLERRTHAADTASAQKLTEPAATAPSPNDRNSSQKEALVEFTRLVSKIEAARERGDLKSVEAGYSLADTLYVRRLAPKDQVRFASFVRNVNAWCEAHRSRSETGTVLSRIRQLLTGLEEIGGTMPTSEIQLVLDTVRELQNSASVPLPLDEEERLTKWSTHMRQRMTEDQDTPPPAAVPALAGDEPRSDRDTGATQTPPWPGRLSREAVERLAGPARDVLMDAARSGRSVLTWGDLRACMKEPLPHLHPDDMGELLVAVDRNTPQGEPLLTTLIASAEASQHWLYPHVRYSLDRPRIAEEELTAHWAREVLKLRQLWRYR
ncbi:hypothetical protein [Streptomyces sp. NPDC002599]|uniref:hypothetical protein n=1 Tax=Streptomyces sp. NPDC002599 TaxID=3154421 RepID=UPI00332A8BC8